MIIRIIGVSLHNLVRQPVRTVLILQGVIWGTALGVFPAAVINGSLRRVEKQAASLGTDRLIITQESVQVPSRFDWELVDQLRGEYSETVDHVTGMAVLEHREGVAHTTIATDADALTARALQLEQGRFLSHQDIVQARPVCVVEQGLAMQVFGETSAVGKQLKLTEQLELVVVGTTAARDAPAVDAFGYQDDHPMRKLVEQLKQYVGAFEPEQLKRLADDMAVMVPHTLFAESRPQWIQMRARPQQVLELRDRVRSRLAAAGYEPVIYVNAILPALYGETIKMALELNRVVFVLCIFVGTSVVCAIMVLSVLERQREIAIRRVEGARGWHIVLQFVVETGTVCAVGGLMGVPLGIVLAILRCVIEPLESVSWTFPAAEVGVLITVVWGIGTVGGLLPAWRALRVDPVEILRNE